jgi:hypothetical protein
MVALVEACVNPVVLRHEGGSILDVLCMLTSFQGHFLPNTGATRTEIVNFAQKYLTENAKSDQEMG